MKIIGEQFMRDHRANWESMAIVYQRIAIESYSKARFYLSQGDLRRAAFYQRQGARDFRMAWYYLNGAILNKRAMTL